MKKEDKIIKKSRAMKIRPLKSIKASLISGDCNFILLMSLKKAKGTAI